MFKERCKSCDRKISKDFEFCPYCGRNLGREREKEDFGFFGKDDNLANFQSTGMFDSLFNQIFKNTMKMMQGDMKALPVKKLDSNVQLFINGKKINLSEMKDKVELPKKEISSEDSKKIALLPREEAETKVRRLTNKIVYEVLMPGVSSLDKVLINKLENSLEIKAIAKDKVYIKNIPLNLPITNYTLKNNSLIIEFKTKN